MYAGYVERQRAWAVRHAAVQPEDGEVAGRHLWEGAVVQVFIALVLDGDGNEAAIGRDGGGIRLAAEVTARLDLSRGDIDYREMAGGCGVALRGVHPDQRLGAGDGDRGRLAVQREGAGGPRRAGIADVDEIGRAQV